MSKILMIDDDERLCEKLKQYFSGFNLELEAFQSPLNGIEAAKDNTYEVLILDGMLPEMDGLDVCSKIREFSEIPIIFLTGRIEEVDKVLGLERGADDYVTKPFSPRELVARIKSQLRRLGARSNSTPSQFGKLSVDTGSYRLFYDKEEIKLTATEFEIFNFLYENKGVIKSREEIMQALHGDTWEAFDRALDISISRMRKKLKSVVDIDLIKTVRLKGYMFVNEL